MNLQRTALAVAVAIATAAALAACGEDENTDGGTAAKASDAPVKLGLITKFPVDFFLAMEEAAKSWDADQPKAEVITGTGKSATDDDGEIALINSMVSQGVKGIAITPTSPAVQPALDDAIAKGVKVVLLDNDLPDWDGKKLGRVDGQQAGRRPRG